MPTPFDTPMRRVQVNTEVKARTLFRKEVAGTECLLLALLQEGDRTSGVLEANGLKVDRTTRKALQFYGVKSDNEDQVRTVKVPYSPAVEDILLRARSIADNRDDDRVTTVHVAIALVRNDTAVVGRLLKELKVDPEKLVNELSQLTVTEPAVLQSEIDDMMEGINGELAKAN